MSADFDFSEVEALADDLGKAAVRIVADTESKALTVTGREFRDDAVAGAPRDTGDLADNIYLRGGHGYRDVGTDKKQGFFQENGTSRHPPQPWIGPAADKAGEALAKRLEAISDPLP